MGGTPTRHHTKARRNKGRAHFALNTIKTTPCPKCKQQILPHRMCANCGTYRGKQVINVLAKLDKKERKQREKVLKETEGDKSNIKHQEAK
ncbi:MAG: 50S ribosomal protein L32 [Parcubacteria group bacterium GW2011_GWA1_45_7]|nr:MAG: 50S ribosomal protein L32 [Parcubacteria group bacterium GW2011_GWA1_45_7]